MELNKQSKDKEIAANIIGDMFAKALNTGIKTSELQPDLAKSNPKPMAQQLQEQPLQLPKAKEEKLLGYSQSELVTYGLLYLYNKAPNESKNDILDVLTELPNYYTIVSYDIKCRHERDYKKRQKDSKPLTK